MAEGVRLPDAEAGAALDLLEHEAADLAAEAEAEGDAIEEEEEANNDDVISSEEKAVRLLQRCWRGYVARKAAWALQEDAYVQEMEEMQQQERERMEEADLDDQRRELWRAREEERILERHYERKRQYAATRIQRAWRAKRKETDSRPVESQADDAEEEDEVDSDLELMEDVEEEPVHEPQPVQKDIGEKPSRESDADSDEEALDSPSVGALKSQAMEIEAQILRRNEELREMLLTRDALLQQREHLQRQIADGVRAIKTAKESKKGAKQSRLRSSTRTGA